MQDNAPLYFAKQTIAYFAKKGYKDTEVMELFSAFPDIKPRKKLNIIKRNVYKDLVTISDK